MADTAVPERIRRLDDAIEVVWSDPDHVGRFSVRALRLACPCAVCVDEISGRPLLDPATVTETLRADRIELVGSYAMRIRFSDGHGSGMQTFQWLRAHCPCDGCLAARA